MTTRAYRVLEGELEHGDEIGAIIVAGAWRGVGCTCRPLGLRVLPGSSGLTRIMAVHDEACPAVGHPIQVTEVTI